MHSVLALKLGVTSMREAIEGIHSKEVDMEPEDNDGILVQLDLASNEL
jgi:hypothetical protein